MPPSFPNPDRSLAVGHPPPYSRNAKALAAEQAAKIAAFLTEFGRAVPCLVVEKDDLIAGHRRVLAVTQPGPTEAQASIGGVRSGLTFGVYAPA